MKFRLLSSLISAAVLMAPSLISAAAFTPGNIVAFRAGNGGTLVNTGNPVFLDEYTTAGALVQSIALPTTVSGGNRQCVTAGNATSEGLISLSSDGNFIVGTCYASDLPAASSLTASTSVSVPRVVFRAAANGVIDTTTALSDFGSAGNPRGAASTNGTDFWATSSSSGVHYAALGATTSTQLATTPTSLRHIAIGGGQLLVSANTGAFRLASVGTGTPTTNGQTITNLNGLPTATVSPYGFVALDRSASIAGIDTLYFADDRASPSGGIFKFSFDGTIWTARGSIPGSARGLTGRIDSGNVVLYVTGTSTTANPIQTATDTAAFDATVTGTLSNLATPVNAPAATAFRGIVFTPAAAQPNLTIAPASGTEGDTPGCSTTQINFTVTSDTAAPVGGIAFTYSTADGSATLADTDYVQVTAGAGNIAAGLTTGTASVNVTCDKNAESNETFSVNLIDGGTYNLGSPSTAAGTINDDDTPVLSVADVSLTEGNAGTSNMTFTVQLDRPAPNGGVSYSYATADIDANAGSDYVATGTQPGSITAGSMSQQHTVTLNGDTDFEANETFSFTVSAATPVAAAGNDFVATGTIQNDDVSALPTISINDVSIAEGNSGTSTLTFNVTLSAPAPVGGVTFDIATADGTATDADNDYEPSSLTGQTIIAGNNSYNFNVTINGDTTFEPNQNFAVSISNATNVAPVGNDTSGAGTITNDDAQPITLNISPVAVAEGHSTSNTTTMTFPVSLDSPAPAGGVTFFAASSDGTATTANSDYTPLLSTQFTIAAGQTTPIDPVTVAVRGDLINESNETFTVTISNAVGTGVSIGSASAIGTINNDDAFPVMTIAQIQGDGSATPVPATPSNVVTSFGNVVTGILNNGFVMQMPVGDGDMETSDAILVFVGTGNPLLATLAIGDIVDVRGPVVEFSNATEFTTGASLVVNRIGPGTLPAAFVLDNVIPSPDPTVPACDPNNDLNPDPADGVFLAADTAATKNYECLEFMRISTATGLVNGPNQAFGAGDPFAEMHMTTNGARSFREPGIGLNVANENVSAISLTPAAPPLPALIWDTNPELLELDVDKFFATTTKNVLAPRTTFSATGLMGFEFSGYEFWVLANSGNTEADLSVISPGPALPIAVPTAGSDQLTVASLNVLRLYDYCDDPGTSAGNEPVNVADTDRKLAKLSAYIRTVLKSPDVIGIQEVEATSATCSNAPANPASALQLLADKIIADLGPTYAVRNSPSTNDPGRISVAFLVRSDRVTIDSTTHLRAAEQWTFIANSTPVVDELHDRPPFLLRATTSIGGAPLSFAVMANHLRSLGGIDDFVPEMSDPTPTGDHENAHRVRRKKLFQAVAVACEAQNFQTANPGVPLLLVGDYNVFQFSDGYTDSAGIIRGDANIAEAEYDAGFDGATGGCTLFPNGQIVSPAFNESVYALPESERYSFVFNGNPQELDHAFLNLPAVARFEGFAYGRGNADAPDREEILPLGAAVLRASDHDGFVVYLNAGSDPTQTGYLLFKAGFED